MKTAPAMGKPNYSISTSLTGDSGEAFMSLLTGEQRQALYDVIARQRSTLTAIVELRRTIASELRHFLQGSGADQEKVLALSRRYGEFDGELSYGYATAFAKIAQSLSGSQKDQLGQLRPIDSSKSRGPFLYSTPIEMPVIENTDNFFGVH